jgi:hypothetical protein
MVTRKIAIPHPSVYRVDVERGEHGAPTYYVMRCEPVAQFDNQEHAAFLVDLLLKGQAGTLAG